MAKPIRPYAPAKLGLGEAINYGDAVIIWQLSLSEGQLRELAADYLMGIETCETLDAYEEYRRRYPDEARVSRRRPSLS